MAEFTLVKVVLRALMSPLKMNSTIAFQINILIYGNILQRIAEDDYEIALSNIDTFNKEAQPIIELAQ